MIEKGKITNGQLAQLIIITIISTSYMYLPAVTATKAGHDSWLSSLLAAAASFIAINLYLNLALHFPGQTLIQFSESLLGKVIGKIVGLLFVFYFLTSNALIVREFAELLSSFVLIHTPLLFFILTMVTLAGITARLGLEVICRSNTIIAALFYFFILLIVVFIFRDLNLEHLTPVLAKGIKPVIAGAIPPFEWFTQSSLILMFIPYLNSTKTTRKTLNLTIGVIGFLFLIAALTTISLFNPKFTQTMDNPMFQVVRYINVGDFIQRIDVVIFSMWIVGVFVKITVFFYAGCLALAQLLNLKEYKALTFPYGSLLVSLSILLFKNASEMLKALDTYIPWYYLIYQLIIPVLFLILTLVLKKGQPQQKSRS